MDSSFLMWLHISLGLISIGFFLKMIIQFGLPNHPARLLAYVVGLSVTVYFAGQALTDMSLLTPWFWIQWRPLPLVAGSLCLLLQTIMLVGNFSIVQQKIISRIPLMAALLCFAFFHAYADHLSVFFVLIGASFLIVSVRKARYQLRAYLKMTLMFCVFLGLAHSGWYLAYLLGQVFLLVSLFYLFVFEHSFGVASLMGEFRETLEEEG